MKFLVCILLLPLLLVIAPPAKGQLEAVLTPTKLPRRMYSAALTYDGDDTIYLIGGSPQHDEILRYSISSGVVEVAGTFRFLLSLDIAETDRDGNPIFLSAGIFHRDVVRYNPLANTTELLATHNYDKYDAASVIKDDVALIIGGGGRPAALLTFDTATHESTIRANLPAPIYNPTAVRVGAAAFVFSRTAVLKIDLETFSSEVIAPGFPRFPYYSRAVYDGQSIYIVGGHGAEIDIPTGGLIRFNPSSYEWKFVPVENFPVSGSEYFVFAPDYVFVEKLNRIYMFGGYVRNSSNFDTDSEYVLQDGIWYIDLNLQNHTTTTTELPPVTTTLFPETFCVNRPNGMYPHPTECDMFLGCRDEVLSIYTCPPPLLFHPEDRFCTFIEDVDCQNN